MALTRSDWERAAYRALLGGGPEAVAVAPLATALGATRGSFYHHFTERRELLEACLERWERLTTEDLIARAEASRDPHERLSLIISLALPTDARVATLELRLAAATDEPTIQDALTRVHERRLQYLTSCFEQLGWDHKAATSRALLAHLCHQGSLHAAAPAATWHRRNDLTAVSALLRELLVQPPVPTSAPVAGL